MVSTEQRPSSASRRATGGSSTMVRDEFSNGPRHGPQFLDKFGWGWGLVVVGVRDPLGRFFQSF